MWQSRPIFVSSTFQDMQAERDHLRNFVFPALEERLRDRRHYLEWVDLRIGVSAGSQADETRRELQVLKVCLAEVRRCRPFLIALIGDRYGTVLPPARIAAALVEEGSAGELAGRSLTDLEIEFGVLSSPDQQTRSYFYFRDPLPYGDMPADMAALYSDRCAAGPGAAETIERLDALKARIKAMLPGRVRSYSVAWDSEHQRVTGLENFGSLVLEDIWAELADETARQTGASEIPPQQAERNALEDFVDERSRDFVGRQAIIERLTRLCLSPDGPPWGICVTGQPGSGKSALFGELFRRLQETDAFVLAHAASASPAAAAMDSMLRRWIDELARALGTDTALAENADSYTLESTFTGLLARMAGKRRVVVLVDALDQFELASRDRVAAWLPGLMSAGIRLVATTLADQPSDALQARPDLELTALPPLDAAEARAVIAGVCARYHRVFEPQLMDAFLTKRGPDGPPWGNPLWLVLAAEELNLIDADDFARIRQSYTGTLAERLRALMLDVVVAMPADIPGLYDATFERAEEWFGIDLVRGFLGLIAVSRAGWRESDFHVLLPRLSGEPWSALRFASLRRLFRGQMRQRGELAQWDFAHAQMRAAVRARLAAKKLEERRLHAILVDHLLACPTDDPARISETMVHLLASEDWVRAADYYGGGWLTGAETAGATRALATAFLASDRGGRAGQPVIRLLDALDESGAVAAKVARKVVRQLLYDFREIIQPRASSEAQTALGERIRSTCARHMSRDPTDTEWQHIFVVCCNYNVTMLTGQYDLAATLQVCRDGLTVSERLAATDPGNEEWQEDLSVSYNRVGNALKDLGDFPAALKAYRQCLGIVERLAAAAPSNANRQRNLAAAHHNVGDWLFAEGNLAEALQAYREGFAVLDRLTTSNPGRSEWQEDLAIIHERIGDVMVAQGNPADALQSFRNQLAIAKRLTGADPGNAQWQWTLRNSHRRIAGVLMRQGDLPAALQALREARVLDERLVAADPGSITWQENLATTYSTLGDLHLKLGDVAEALAEHNAAIEIGEKARRKFDEQTPGKYGGRRAIELARMYNSRGDAKKRAQGQGPEAAIGDYDAAIGLLKERRAAQTTGGASDDPADLFASYLKRAAATYKIGQPAIAASYAKFAEDLVINDIGAGGDPATRAAQLGTARALQGKVHGSPGSENAPGEPAHDRRQPQVLDGKAENRIVLAGADGAQYAMDMVSLFSLGKQEYGVLFQVPEGRCVVMGLRQQGEEFIFRAIENDELARAAEHVRNLFADNA